MMAVPCAVVSPLSSSALVRSCSPSPLSALRARRALLCRSHLRRRALDDDSARVRRRLVPACANPFLRQPILHWPPALGRRGAPWLCLPLRLGVPAGVHFLRVVYPRRLVSAVIVSPWCVGPPLAASRCSALRRVNAPLPAHSAFALCRVLISPPRSSPSSVQRHSPAPLLPPRQRPPVIPAPSVHPPSGLLRRLQNLNRNNGHVSTRDYFVFLSFEF